MKSCDRCNAEMNNYTMSMFNIQEICNECEDREKAHPNYPQAIAAEHQACMRGDFNYPGIGLPKELSH